MRQIFVKKLDREVSALGFGCASLGSRISAAQGARALHDAFEQGVTWFDVAPPYGDGKAEELLGQFLRGRRDKVAVCTKVGIKPPRLSLAARFGKPLIRTVLGLAPGLRKQIAERRPPSSRATISPEAIELSVTDSLRRLKVDYVDVLALHDPTLEETLNDDIRAALFRIREKGYARIVGVAGDQFVGERGVDAGYSFLQHAVPRVTSHPLPANILRVNHSVYGFHGALSRLSVALQQKQALRKAFQDLGYAGSDKNVAANALMDYALSNNANGIVLTSMFNPEHLRFNVSRASRSPDQKIVDLMQRHAFAA